MSVIQIRPQFKPQQTKVSQTMILDGVRVQLDTYRNKYDNSWYLDLFDGQGNAIFSGVALTVGLDLLYPYRYKAGVPPGILMVQDQSGEPFDDPTLDSFNNDDAIILYITEDQEFVALPAEPEPVTNPPPVPPPVP